MMLPSSPMPQKPSEVPPRGMQLTLSPNVQPRKHPTLKCQQLLLPTSVPSSVHHAGATLILHCVHHDTCVVQDNLHAPHSYMRRILPLSRYH